MAMALAVVFGCVLGAGLREAREHASESVGIDRAQSRRESDALWRYLEAGGRQRGRADVALLALAAKESKPGPLLEYLKHGRDTESADRVLFERTVKENSIVAYELYLNAGGHQRLEAEKRFLKLARESRRSADLERYLAVAQLDKDLVRKKLLPEAVLAEASEPHQVLALRHYLEGDIAPEAKEAIQSRIDNLYRMQLRIYDKVTAQGSHRVLVAKMMEHLAAGKPIRVEIQTRPHPDFDARVSSFLARNSDSVSPKSFLADPDKIASVWRLNAARGIHRIFDEHLTPVSGESADPAARLVIRYEVGAADAVWVMDDSKQRFLSLQVKFTLELTVPGAEGSARSTFQFEPDALWYRRNSGRTPYSRMLENAGNELEDEVERLIRE